MSKAKTSGPTHEIAFEAFGVRVLVRVSSAEELNRARALLPPDWRQCTASAVQKRFALVAGENGRYEFFRDGESFTRGLELDHALTLLEAQLRAFVALHAPDRIFVHAGVVASEGRTIVMPGMSFAGKTTLVAALVRAGAIYYSDEFAVLDEHGLVHPYRKPLSIRNDNLVQIDHHVDSLGGTQGDGALPVGAIVVTRYRPGVEWQPRRGSPGEGVIALLANTVAARERPPEVMRALTRAADGAVVLESERGEADALAPVLLEELAN